MEAAFVEATDNNMSEVTTSTSYLDEVNISDIYFITPHPDPELAECASIVLRSDLEVSLYTLYRVSAAKITIF